MRFKQAPKNIHSDILTPRDAAAIERARKYTTQWTKKDRPVLLAWKQGRQFSAYCPLCGTLHNHSPYPGHRCSHCESITADRRGGYYLLVMPGSVPDEVLDAAGAIERVRRRYYERQHDNRYYPEKFSIDKALSCYGLIH